MADKVLLYPSLTEDLIKKVRFQKTKYTFFYVNADDEERELVDEPADVQSSVSFIKDESGEWDQDKYRFGFKRNYCLQTFQWLFGAEGIACRDAVLGLAIAWKSADSKQRGVIPVGTFKRDDRVLDVGVKKVFGKAQLRGQVDFSTILYIAGSGHPDADELHLANTNGYVLGEFETITIKLDGSGSTFPVFEVYEPRQPLWYVKCDWIDPTTDALSDSVSINLNTAHKNYKYIDGTKSTFNSQLLTEIMAAAITVIIEKIRNSGFWDQIMQNDELEDGSVGQAVYYFSNTLEWDLSSPESVSLAARKFFDKRM